MDYEKAAVLPEIILVGMWVGPKSPLQNIGRH